jgi:hypothetical protein
LSAEQRAWAAIYQDGNTWRFKSEANGYEQTYRIHNLENKKQGHSGGKFDVTAEYFGEELYAEVERTDSAYSRPRVNFHYRDLYVQAQTTQSNPNGQGRFSLNWAGTVVPLAVDDFEKGSIVFANWQLVPQATYQGRTYQNVFVYTAPRLPLQLQGPNHAAQIYYTKQDGVIRFVEFSGQVWNRL